MNCIDSGTSSTLHAKGFRATFVKMLEIPEFAPIMVGPPSIQTPTSFLQLDSVYQKNPSTLEILERQFASCFSGAGFIIVFKMVFVMKTH